MNFALTLQYDGADFHGWQIQAGRRTIQGELTRVLGLLDGRDVIVHGSGRTDAGVHAEAQVASVRLAREITPVKLRAALNGNLPADVRVLDVRTCPDDFHARFSARGKTYVYRVFHGPVMSPFWRRYAHHEARPLDLELMKNSARLMCGPHDWTAFSAARSDATTRVRTITRLDIEQRWDERGQGTLVEMRVSADGFLRYMVRTIAGALLAVGRGELDAADVERSLETGQRSLAAVTAPAHGLTLARVSYD